MKILYIYFICISQSVISQMHQCPIEKGIIIDGYKNDEYIQRYEIYLKKDEKHLPVDLTILTVLKDEKIKSSVKGKVIYTDQDTNLVGILFDNNELITYDLVKDISVSKGDSVEIGTNLGKPMLSTFPPSNYKNWLNTENELYNINMTFYYYDKEKQILVHKPISLESLNCKIITCSHCQPLIYH